MNSQADYERFASEQNKPNRNYRITPDLMNCDELAIDRYSKDNPGGFARMKDEQAAENKMSEMAEEASRIHDSRTDRPLSLDCDDDYDLKKATFRPRGLTATDLERFGCSTLPGRRGYGVSPLTGRHFDKTLADDLISDYILTMTVDPAVKNKNKKERKMDELRGSVPMEPPRTADVYSVDINRVENGFIVKVGCKTFVSTSWKEAAKALGEYFDDPIAAEKKYCKKGD